MARSKAHYGVSIRDLVSAGILKPGDALTCEPRKGEVYTGHIENNGDLVLGDQTFNTPSRAASTLAGNSRDGWEDIVANGRPLKAYRDEYLRANPGLARAPALRGTSSSQPPALSSPSSPISTVAQPANRGPSTPDGLVPISTQQPADSLDSPIAERLLEKLRAMTDKEFEEFVGRVLVRLGYEEVNVVGRSHDRGLDVECIHTLPLVEPPVSVACQVKRHAGTVGGSVVGDLRGRWAHRVDRLILVNLGGFTAGAREEAAEQPGAKPVKLISGQDLADLMAREGIGVHREPVVMETIDETFFGPFAS